MDCKYAALRDYCDNFYKNYKYECFDKTPYGDCTIFSALIYTLFPQYLEVVGGRCVTDGDGAGPHWWLEYNGKVIDPLGDDWAYKIIEREEINRGPADLLGALKIQRNHRSGNKVEVIDYLINKMEILK